MELVMWILGLLGAILSAVLVQLITMEAFDRIPGFMRGLILVAASRLPPSIRSLYQEQWLRDLEDRVGVLSKLGHAIGYLRCTQRLIRDTNAELADRDALLIADIIERYPDMGPFQGGRTLKLLWLIIQSKGLSGRQSDLTSTSAPKCVRQLAACAPVHIGVPDENGKPVIPTACLDRSDFRQRLDHL